MKIYMALGKMNIIGRYVKFCRLFLTPILKTHFPSMATLFLLHIFIFLLFLNISNISITIELVLYYIIHIIPSTHIFYKYYIFSAGKVAMDPVKVAGVCDWPIPRNVTEVRSFLGFINFYRRFVDGFSHIAKPLNNLTKANTQWSWTPDGLEQAAFDELKHLITSTPILVLPDQTKHFCLETDASAYATGAVLSQLCDNGKWRPISFVSKSLSDTEHNYAIHDKELLSVIRGLEEWHHILEGTKYKIEILNDHQNLTYFCSAQNLNRRQARWSLYLSPFDFELIHHPGRHSAKPDALSRWVDHKRGEEDNQNQMLLQA